MLWNNAFTRRLLLRFSLIVRFIKSIIVYYLEFGENNTDVPIIDEGIGSIPYLRQCVDEIIRLIDFMTKRFPFWEEPLQVRAGIAAWDADVDSVYNHEAIDLFTKNQDFSSDIFARAQFYAANGYS